MTDRIDHTQKQIETFTLVLLGGDGNKKRAAELIRELTPKERRDLRAACQNVDNLVDDTWLEELREKRNADRK